MITKKKNFFSKSTAIDWDSTKIADDLSRKMIYFAKNDECSRRIFRKFGYFCEHNKENDITFNKNSKFLNNSFDRSHQI